MQVPFITEEYKSLISRSPNILAIRFVGKNPVEIIAKDSRFSDVDQCLLTRDEILKLDPIQEEPKVEIDIENETTL